MLVLDNVTKKYQGNLILDEISYDFPDAGFYVIHGDNGCGKTSLFYLLSNMDKEYSGHIYYNHKLLKRFSRRENVIYQKEIIGFISSTHNLIEELSLEDNLSLFGVEDTTSFSNFDLTRKPNTLSGGEEMIFTLKLFSLLKKKIYLLDECTSNLDDATFLEVISLLQTLSQDNLVILTSHDSRRISGCELWLQNHKLYHK